MNNLIFNTKRITSDDKTILFESMVKSYSKDLYRYAVWLTRDADSAEDLVQETFLRAWNGLDKLKDPAAVKSWLYTILRRENARRFEKKRPELVALEEIDIDLFGQVDEEKPKSEIYDLHRALTELPTKYSEPLVLQVLGGYTCKEISNIIGLKPGAVMTRIFRAREKLRSQLEQNVPNQQLAV